MYLSDKTATVASMHTRLKAKVITSLVQLLSEKVQSEEPASIFLPSILLSNKEFWGLLPHLPIVDGD